MTDETAGPGHNNPPSRIEELIAELGGIALLANEIPSFDAKAYADLRALISRISEDSAAWIRLGEIPDAETAAIAADHIAQLRAAKKKCEEARKDAKALWTEKANDAYAVFTRLVDTTTKGVDKMLSMQTAFLAKEQARKDAEAAALRAEAEKRRAELEAEKARAEAAGDIMGLADADAEEKEVKAQEKAAAAAAKTRVSVGTASGAGRKVTQRSVKVATVTNHMTAMLHYKDHPRMKELVQDLASAEARAADFDAAVHKIPGCTVEVKIVAA